jgi:MFS family permease
MACFPGYVLGTFLALVMGLAMVTQMATTNNYMQCHAPDGLRGRIVACYTTTVIGCFPIGCLLMGLLADWLGVRAALGLGGLIGFTNALWMFSRLEDAPVAAAQAGEPAVV